MNLKRDGPYLQGVYTTNDRPEIYFLRKKKT